MHARVTAPARLTKVKIATGPAGDTSVMETNGFDCYSPRQIAERVESACLAKATTPLLSLAMLGVLAGAFIGLGSKFYVIVASDPTLGFAASRVLGGLFTGNNLLAMAWAQRALTTRDCWMPMK